MVRRIERERGKTDICHHHHPFLLHLLFLHPHILCGRKEKIVVHLNHSLLIHSLPPSLTTYPFFFLWRMYLPFHTHLYIDINNRDTNLSWKGLRFTLLFSPLIFSSLLSSSLLNECNSEREKRGLEGRNVFDSRFFPFHRFQSTKHPEDLIASGKAMNQIPSFIIFTSIFPLPTLRGTNHIHTIQQKVLPEIYIYEESVRMLLLTYIFHPKVGREGKVFIFHSHFPTSRKMIILFSLSSPLNLHPPFC